MTVSEYTRDSLARLLREKRVVVWYDADRHFGEFVRTFAADQCKVVDARGSLLTARREAESIYRGINGPDPETASANLLIYCPWARGATGEQKEKDILEVFATVGAAFGDKEAEMLQSLARHAMPDRWEQIDRMFREGKPTLAILDSLVDGKTYPLVRQTLQTESAVEAAAKILCDDEAWPWVLEVPGAREEALRLLSEELGFAPAGHSSDPRDLVNELGRYVLFSEFALDFPGELPTELRDLPVAGDAFRSRVLSCCDRMRTDTNLVDNYAALAASIEGKLRLPSLIENGAALGKRETFPFEERAYLKRVADLAAAGSA